MKKTGNTVIDEKTPLLVLAGPMFLEHKKKWLGKSVIDSKDILVE